MTSIDAETAAAVRRFMQRLDGKYPVVEGILFGSRARRTHSDESDADLAVILAGETGKRSEAVRDMGALAFDILMETGVLVSALPL